MYNSSYWSSVSFTPWIVYRGCFSSKFGGKYFVQNQNTVGNCFSSCDWYCNLYNIALSNFALEGKVCYCYCNKTDISHWKLAGSNKCNITCQNSTEDGFCGGNGHMSFYKVDKDNRAGGEFCLAYNCHLNKIYGHNCTQEYEGYCVTKNRDETFTFTKQLPMTWSNYSRACKSQNKFMTAYQQEWPRHPSCNGHAWTGIRTYLITNYPGSYFTSFRSCYTVQWNFKWEYVRSNCYEKHHFICKFQVKTTTGITNFIATNTKGTKSLRRISTEILTMTGQAKHTRIAPNYGTSPEFTVSPTTDLFFTEDPTSIAKNFGRDFQKRTTIVNIASKGWTSYLSKDNDESKSSTIGIIVGSTLAVFLCASICLLLLYLKRKRKLRTPSVKFTNNAYEEKSVETNNLRENAIYINETSKNCSQTTAKSDHDDVYVENAEGVYDSLHSSRQKKSSYDNPQYDSTIGWDNVYSSTTHQDNTNHGNSDESDYNTLDGTRDGNSSMENSDYDTCNRYVTSDGNLYQKV
ncbi:uncharacterized protein LOC134265764 isoform X2 [Saccostrea cucullata]|uniref:uncharacterized protein LOC134265764 isoform X2 n=1 Tax=Saccostrea cuccullata TaxID=36930 RepID=UPI002ED4C84B